MDDLDDDELDETSADAFETTTKKGDEELNDESELKDQKASKSKGSTEKKPKRGNERENESLVARSG
jgi:hypothetical protein